MSARVALAIGLAVATVAVGGWRVLLPGASRTSRDAVSAVTDVLGTVTSAQFTAAQATLEAQRSSTGSYAGAPLAPPLVLVRANASSYCIQLVQGSAVHHLSGPGGSPAGGPC